MTYDKFRQPFYLWRPCQAAFITLNILLFTLQSESAVVPPPWSDPVTNPCANMSGGWQLLYWPPLAKCFKIFTIGYPCPESMELSPAFVSNRKLKHQRDMPAAECRCPPGTALHNETNVCHELFERGPCKLGQYFAPMSDEQNGKVMGNRMGTCKTIGVCPDAMTFWPKEEKCYTEYTKGPCAKGKLLVNNDDGYGECKCEATGALQMYYYELEQTCHEHYTKGPCTTPGQLFLPGGICDCQRQLPHYHQPMNMCFELNTPGPCPLGHVYSLTDQLHAVCQCKEGFVTWPDGNCYRLYTRGPCKANEFLINATTCAHNLCGKSQLYFPEQGTCYRIGSQGPCNLQEVVVFDYSARPSVEGISYKGVCGCTGIIKNLDQRCSYSELNKQSAIDECISTPGMVQINGKCYKLYTRGPCGPDQWLTPTKPELDNGKRQNYNKRAKCACRPGYTLDLSSKDYTTERSKYEWDYYNLQQRCSAPNVSLARWFFELFG